MREIKILLVEDEKIIALDMAITLKKQGYKVAASVETGEEAIKLSEEKRPDLVLMDIKLKGKCDGIEAAQLIHDNFHIPIVFISAYADRDTLLRANSIPPMGYLTKPIEITDLQDLIKKTFLYAN